jgi:adenylate cyclase
LSMEHERRFLLDSLPLAEPVDLTTIRQAYWRLGDGWSMRVRREGRSDSDTRNSVTIKGPRNGVSRPELNMFLPDDSDSIEAVEKLFMAAGSHKIVKTRYSFLLDDLPWDVDLFHWENEGLIIAELEMDDPAELARITKPTWAVREVTYEAQYSNDNLAFRPYKSW